MHRQIITIEITLDDEGHANIREDLAASEAHNAPRGCTMPPMDEHHENTMLSILTLSAFNKLIEHALPEVLGSARAHPPSENAKISMHISPMGDDGQSLGMLANIDIGMIELASTKH